MVKGERKRASELSKELSKDLKNLDGAIRQAILAFSELQDLDDKVSTVRRELNKEDTRLKETASEIRSSGVNGFNSKPHVDELDSEIRQLEGDLKTVESDLSTVDEHIKSSLEKIDSLREEIEELLYS